MTPRSLAPFSSGGSGASFAYRRGRLRCRGLDLERIAQRFGTPCYVYDLAGIIAAYRDFQAAIGSRPHLVCASVKANGNLAVLRLLRQAGSGFDIVSAGELHRVLLAGGDPAKVVFSGVGKTAEEMDAALAANILLFNVESAAELAVLAARAGARRRVARFGLRLNPDIAAPTHPHIATGLRRHKFGVAPEEAFGLYRAASRGRWLEAAGVSVHVGSQLRDPRPFAAAARALRDVVTRLRAEGLHLRFVDVGGGWGAAYRPREMAPPVARYIAALASGLDGLGCVWLLEPGRRLFAAAGALLTRVLYCKAQGAERFAIVDAASNDFMRPVLYGAYHRIVPLRRRAGLQAATVAGPVCESGDLFARNRRLPPMRTGDVLAILDAGAYGFSLASNYNGRRRPPEIGVEGGRARLLRRRETYDDLVALEVTGKPSLARPVAGRLRRH